MSTKKLPSDEELFKMIQIIRDQLCDVEGQVRTITEQGVIGIRGITSGIDSAIPQCNDILKSIAFWFRQVSKKRERQKEKTSRISDHILTKIIEMRDEAATLIRECDEKRVAISGQDYENAENDVRVLNEILSRV